MNIKLKKGDVTGLVRPLAAMPAELSVMYYLGLP